MADMVGHRRFLRAAAVFTADVVDSGYTLSVTWAEDFGKGSLAGSVDKEMERKL